MANAPTELIIELLEADRGEFTASLKRIPSVDGNDELFEHIVDSIHTAIRGGRVEDRESGALVVQVKGSRKAAALAQQHGFDLKADVDYPAVAEHFIELSAQLVS